MKMIQRFVWGLALSLVLFGGAAQGEVKYRAQWKVASTGVWPPTVFGTSVLFKSGNTLSAHSLESGKRLWQVNIPDLRYGAGIMAAGDTHIYVLSKLGVLMLDPATGKQVKQKKIAGANSVLYRPGSVYVSGSKGIYQLDPTLAKQQGVALGFTGELRGADAQYVVIYCHEAGPGAGKGSPNRLKVVDLKRGKQVYQFKLLPGGGHKVIKVGGGRVVFIDYTRKQRGKNSTKLYYTEADYVRSKKLKDISLSDQYKSAKSDTFWVAGDPGGQLFFANHGDPGAPSVLLAYDPAQGKVLWSRGGQVSSMGVLLHKGKLWTGLNKKGGPAKAVLYSPDDGNPVFSHPLDSPGTGSPVATGEAVLLRTRKSVYCFVPAVKKAPSPTVKPAIIGTTDDPDTPRPGWKMMRHKPSGFVIQIPQRWHLDKKKKVKLGGVRHVIPFARKQKLGKRVAYVGSVTVLTWEAAGRNVDQLWQSIYAQRRGISPDVRVTKVHRVKNVGGTGVTGIRAVYSFKGPRGYPVQLRSLCLIHHGVAFELRAWAGPSRPAEIWKQVEQIFSTFKPKKF